MVVLVALLEPAEDRDRVGHVGLADEDRLEAPLERGVLLDVLAELVERGRADRPQLAAGEHRLEQVGGVDRALGGAGADDRVELVDEEDDLALGLLDLVEHGLQPLLELAAVLRAGEQRADVERDHACGRAATRARRRRRSAGRGPRRSRSCRRRGRRSGPGCSSSGARAPGSTRRISSSRPMTGSSLPASASAVRSWPNFSSASSVVLGVGRGDPVRTDHLGGGLRDRVAVGQDVGDAGGVVGQREQDVAARRCTRRRAPASRARSAAARETSDCGGAALGRVAAGDGRQVGDQLVDARPDRDRVGAELAEHRRREPVLLLEQRREQVRGRDLGVAVLGGEPLRDLEGLADLGGESVCLHDQGGAYLHHLSWRSLFLPNPLPGCWGPLSGLTGIKHRIY